MVVFDRVDWMTSNQKKIMSGLSARRKYPSYMKIRTETNLNKRNIVPSKKVTAMP